MMMESGALQRSSRPSRAHVLALIAACGLGVGAGEARAANPDLEQVLYAPIIEGQAAAGLRLGNDRETTARALGEPEKVMSLNKAILERYVYRRVDPTLKSLTMIWVTFTIGLRGADSISIIDARQPPTAFGYVGRTSTGYRMGESARRLTQLYGEPDAVIKQPPMMRAY